MFLSRHPACSGSGDTGGRGRGRVSALCQAALRKRTDGHAMDQGLSLDQACCGHSPASIFLSVFYIFWNSDLRCVYLSQSHRCFVSLHFWVICKGSDKSEITPVSQWDSLHASWPLNCVSFYIFRIWTLIGHNNCQFVLHFILHFSFYWRFSMVRLLSLIYSHLFTFPFISFAFTITPKLHCQDWCTGTQ